MPKFLINEEDMALFPNRRMLRKTRQLKAPVTRLAERLIARRR